MSDLTPMSECVNMTLKQLADGWAEQARREGTQPAGFYCHGSLIPVQESCPVCGARLDWIPRG